MIIKASYTHTRFDTPFKPIDMKTNDPSANIDSENLLMVRGQWMF